MLQRTPTESSRATAAMAGVKFVWAHRWFVLVALALAVVGAWQGARIILGPAVVVDEVRRGALVETVVASGHVETPFRVEIGSQITGTVEDVLVKEGEHVVKDQPLVSLDARELNAAVVQAQGAVEQADARIRQLTELTLPSAREQLAQARANLTNAQQTFDRTSQLFNSGSTTRAALDEAQKNLDVARTLVRTAELQVYTADVRGSDYVMAQTQLRQAHANLETAQSRLSYATIRAPRDGVLISRNVEKGTVVQPGRALLVLAPSGDTQLVLQIDERNLGKIALDQPALASADAFPDRRFAARVSYINPGVDISRASVQVKLVVPDPPAYLRQDMTVSVDIETARRPDTLVLPMRSVRDALLGQPWIMTIRDGRAVKAPVKLGIRGNGNGEILAGAAEGEFAIPATAGVVTGQRVRAVKP